MQHISLKEMADFLGISAKTFRKDIAEKQIPFYPSGKRMRFDPYEVKAYLKTTEQVTESNVRLFPVTKHRKVVTSKKFAEA